MVTRIDPNSCCLKSLKINDEGGFLVRYERPEPRTSEKASACFRRNGLVRFGVAKDSCASCETRQLSLPETSLKSKYESVVGNRREEKKERGLAVESGGSPFEGIGKTTEEISIKSNRGRSQTRILGLLVLQGATIESIEREQIFKDMGKTFKLKRE